MNRQKWIVASVVVAVLCAFGVGLYSGVSERAASAQTITTVVNGSPANVDMAQFWQAWNILQQNFVQTHASGTIPTDQKKIFGAIAGLTASYGDPYTVFFPPADAQVFNDDVNGSFSGVGMEMGESNNQLAVVAPLKDSPAQKAGIRSGDIILAIGTTTTENMAVDDAVKLIRGPKGTTVKLSVLHKGDTKPTDISIVRDTINIPVIDTKDEGGVFTISLYSFSQNSQDLFRDALRKYFESGDTKLILDLRGDPGGYLDSAVEIASYFLPVGDTVVTEDYKGNGTNIIHRSKGYNVFANKKLSMAILIDQGSASASEILAGALSQHGVAKLIGTRSFGKGSVQQLVDIGGGAELKVTIARWLTPNGTSISDGGLTPDIKVDRTADDAAAGKDPQKQAALTWLATQ